MFLNIKNQRNLSTVCHRCVKANNFFTRFLGFIGRKQIDKGEGIFFPKSNAIHMMFMRTPIDVVFIENRSDTRGNKKIVHSLYPSVKPWKLMLADFKADATLELGVGTISQSDLQVGDELTIVQKTN